MSRIAAACELPHKGVSEEMGAAYREYRHGYKNGYSDAIEDMRLRQRKRRQQERIRQQRRWYFIKQRLTGLFLIVFTALIVKALDGDATIALITVPLGLYLIFTKEMCIENNFYWEMKEGSNGNL